SRELRIRQAVSGPRITGGTSVLQCHRAAVDRLSGEVTSSREISHRSLTRSQTSKTLARVSKVLPSRFLPTTRYEIAVETCVPSRLNRKSSSFGRMVNW